MKTFLSVACLVTVLAPPLVAEPVRIEIDPQNLRLEDVFELEFASDPQLSPDGTTVVYVRNFMDVVGDRRRSNLWTVDPASGEQRPLTTGLKNDASPRFTPDGKRLVYVSRDEGSAQLWLRWLDSGQTARLTQLQQPPRGLAVSPDGRHVAFSMLVEERPEPFVKLPKPPPGAEWADPPKVIDKLVYRRDGEGYVPDGYAHLFVVSTDGGTPRQVTSGPYHHRGVPVWTPDSERLVFSANRHDDWQYDPEDTELYELRLKDGEVRALTDRHGSDEAPALSPDGRFLAWVGHDERYLGYQIDRLYVLDRQGDGGPRLLAGGLDRSVAAPAWSADGAGVYFQYDDQGNGKIGFASLDGGLEVVARDLGGLSLGRPYGGGSFTLGPDGRFVYTHTRPDHPADLAAGRRGEAAVRRLTELNADLFDHKRLGEVEEIWFESSHDGRKIQGWIAKPPGFDPAKKYPLVLEIHGGPFADYGDRFAAEIQLYAAAGYVVLYLNPRGSTSYGENFGNLIHHAYPSHDYDDLMSGVDAVLTRGYVDERNLFVTGGSGGGVLTAWIVGHTHRFRAAVVAKPVINWYSFVLHADNAMYYKYWFPGFPWDHLEHYMARSPLSYVGNVETPTMLLTGESDFRTPISESEQFHRALMLRRVDTMLVRIPDASHGIANRPSHLMAKVAYILGWFEKHGD